MPNTLLPLPLYLRIAMPWRAALMLLLWVGLLAFGGRTAFVLATIRDGEPLPDAVASLWNHGSVVRSWLLELAARAFEQDGDDLGAVEGWVDDSGEGRWTVEAAIDHAVPLPVITAALFARFSSRQDDSPDSGISLGCRSRRKCSRSLARSRGNGTASRCRTSP